MKDFFLKLMFNVLKKQINYKIIYHFYQKELKKIEKLVANLDDKTDIHIYTHKDCYTTVINCYTHEEFKARIK